MAANTCGAEKNMLDKSHNHGLTHVFDPGVFLPDADDFGVFTTTLDGDAEPFGPASKARPSPESLHARLPDPATAPSPVADNPPMAEAAVNAVPPAAAAPAADPEPRSAAPIGAATSVASQPVAAAAPAGGTATNLTSAGVSTATGIKTTQIALGANVATSLYGVTGAGLKIGIISDSYNATGGAAADMANGLLPANVTVLSDASTGTDEGRAMMELAYSIAPGASYYTAEGSSLAAEVTALQNAGVNVIVDDLSVGGEALYQLGSATDVAIEAAVASGVDYFTSAGNNGNDYYEQGFTPLTTTIAGIGSNLVVNNFGNNSPYLSLTLPANFLTRLAFQFAQPFGSFGTGANSPTNSLAIYLLDANGNVVASSVTNDIGGDPTQEIDYTTNANTAYRLVVVQNGGAVPAGQLFKFFLNDNNGTINSPNAGKGSGDLLGHEMLPNINVLGSVAYTNTPAFGVSPAVIDGSSSVGPGEVLFDPQGNALTMPVTEGVPQFEAPDGTLTGTANTGFATSPFFGTSAAAPSAGAVSALVLQADTALTTAQVTSVLAQSVIPVTVTAPSSGAGLIQARAGVEIAAADAGNRWTMSAGGNWNTGTSWSGGAAPTSAQAAGLSDNLGAFTGAYTVTVNTLGDAAGSLAISAPAGSSATVVVAAGGALTIGPPGATASAITAGDITSGDLLVSDNGTLNVTGGVLSESGSLNVNNGTVAVSSGSVTANNYAQTAGGIMLGGGSAVASLMLTGTGFAETGGTVSIMALGTLTTTLISDSASMFSTATGGTVTDSGTASFAGTAGLNNAGSFSVTGAASFLASTITDSGSFNAGSVSISESTFTGSGSLSTTGALQFDDTGATVAKGATVNAGSLGVGSTLNGFANTLTVAGKITDSGALGAGTSTVGTTISLLAGGELDVGGASTGVGVTFTGNGLLAFTASNTTVLANQLTGVVSGLALNNGAIDFTGLTYNSLDTITYGASNGQVDVFDQNGNDLLTTYLNTAVNYTGLLKVQSDGATNHVEVAVACYCVGTLILTTGGEMAVQDLAIGAEVVTESGALRPIKWIGRRSYAGRFLKANPELHPIRFQAGCLGDGLPRRDLLVSPKHAMFLDGMLIPAKALVNGGTIKREPSMESVEYFHIELDTHDVILAEGAPSETYIDDDSREMFHNAGSYRRLYPDTAETPALFCAPRVEDGFALEAIRHRMPARAEVA